MIKSVFKWWDDFWFGPTPLLNVGVFRFVLCSTLAVLYFFRTWNINDLFTEGGMVQFDMALKMIPDFYKPPFLIYFATDSTVHAVHFLLVASLSLLALGIGGRPLALLAWILDAGFIQRNYSAVFGADLIGSIFLLYLAFTQSCHRFSILNLFRPRGITDSDIVSSVFVRIMQLQICIIYAYTGFEKLKGQSWWDGSALWTVLGNPQMTVTDLSFAAQFPLIISAVTFITIIFEIYFVALVVSRKTRPWVLLTGVLFHSGIAVIMNLHSFAIIMMSTYILFLDSETLERLVRLLRAKLPLVARDA
jgi:hypothetical protein